MSLAVGTRLGPYEVLGLTGAGGMGEVYKARDTRLARTVAIKVLPAELSADPERRARFEREARAASALNHPNLCTVYDIGSARLASAGENALDFIAMEWIEGVALADAIPAGGLVTARALTIARQIAGGMAAAHHVGIVHRDIKPANVLLRGDGAIKIVDFGLAKEAATSDAAETVATEAGRFMGTPGYASPEQVRGATLDARTDVFAIGCVLYEVFTGRRAFGERPGTSLLTAVLEEAPPPLRAVRRDVPRSVEAIVARALQKNPEARYASAVDLSADLDAVEAAQAARRIPVTAVLHRPVAIAMLVLLAAAAALGGWLRWRQHSREAWVRGTAIPQAKALVAKGQDHAFAALRLLQQAEALTPDDPQLRELLNEASAEMRVSSDPAGADIYIRDFNDPGEQWQLLGRAPLVARLPTGTMFLWKVWRDGFLPQVLVGWDVPEQHFTLIPLAGAPAGMVFVPGGTQELYSSTATVDAFWVDATEVTNSALLDFVRKGGYERSEYWTGLPRDLVASFVDRTGRPGPSTWEVGLPPEGQADYPVGGVSAYEAAAYCRSVGKDLPTIFHWYEAAFPAATTQWAALSNFQSSGPQPVGQLRHVNAYGTYDMAGNVREWTRTETGSGARYTLGGSYSEPSYTFWDPWTAPPETRDAHFGFRCVQYSARLNEAATAVVPLPFRDYRSEEPVADELFAAFARFYQYDRRRPLEPRTESVDRSAADYTVEQVSLAAAYGAERFRAFVILPKAARPPYQAVVFFDGGPFVTRGSFDVGREKTWLLFLVRSGRAAVLPEYKGSFERAIPARTPGTLSIFEPEGWREIIIHSALDLRRTIDYLETRDDIDARKIAYYGLSFGAGAGGIMTAVEPRFGASVLLAGGLYPWKRPPEVDVFNFVSRVRVPTLVINGEHDTYFNVEGSQKPMFQWLGARPKERLLLPSGHIPSEKDQWVGAMLKWLDTHLGPVTPQ